MKVATGDVIAEQWSVTAVANPATSMPRVSVVNDDGETALLRWDGASWREETP